MQFFMSLFLGLLVSVSVSAESLLEGRVRLSSGQPAAGVQVRLFDLTKLHQSVATTTDETGYFVLSLPASSPGSVLPQGFALGHNYPNPFNPSTIIPYQIPTTAHVRLEVLMCWDSALQRWWMESKQPGRTRRFGTRRMRRAKPSARGCTSIGWSATGIR